MGATEMHCLVAMNQDCLLTAESFEDLLIAEQKWEVRISRATKSLPDAGSVASIWEVRSMGRAGRQWQPWLPRRRRKRTQSSRMCGCL